MKQKFYTIPVFIPELACPFQCVFCDQRKISGHADILQPDEVPELIEKYISTFKEKESIIYTGFFGGNFTGIPLNLQEDYLKAANVYLENGKIQGIRLSTRPDYINKEVIDLLKKYNVSAVELGAQSFDDEVLVKSGRGHKASDIVRASDMIKSAGIKLGLQMMIGLPGDTPERSYYTAEKIIENGADNTRIYPTVIIRGTALERLYKAGKYKPLSLMEAVETTKKVYLLFEKNNVNVIRTGLHPSEELLSGDQFVAGPFHKSFGELVYTSIWKDILMSSFDRSHGKNITIKISPKEINYAIGYQSTNKIMLSGLFETVKFASDNSLDKRQFGITYN